MQERTRRSWERVLEVGLDLLQSGGVAAVTVKEVCRRARITPPTLYARVDGLAGLLAAVYDHALVQVRGTEELLLRQLPRRDAPIDERVAGIVTFMDETFARHQSLLRPIVTSSMSGGVIYGRGVLESRRVQDLMITQLALPSPAADDIAAMVFSEVVVRNVYGPGFAGAEDETQDAFRARVTRTGIARAYAA